MTTTTKNIRLATIFLTFFNLAIIWQPKQNTFFSLQFRHKSKSSAKQWSNELAKSSIKFKFLPNQSYGQRNKISPILTFLQNLRTISKLQNYCRVANCDALDNNYIHFRYDWLVSIKHKATLMLCSDKSGTFSSMLLFYYFCVFVVDDAALWFYFEDVAMSTPLSPHTRLRPTKT